MERDIRRIAPVARQQQQPGKHLEQTFENALGPGVLAIAGLASLPSQADQTHLNVDHREMVQLRMGSSLDALVASSCPANFNKLALQEVLTTGNLANREFTVPAGKELCITDVEYTISNGLA
jgi:hypothetical protein